ncbi:MAG: cox cluster protein [Haloferacaceae archaeon]
MDEDPGLSDQYRTASPWPLFVALGIPISELGLLFDLFPVAVGGLVLFCGSVAGMSDEAGYVDGPWGALGMLALLCFAAGALLLAAVGQPTRGAAVLVAGALLLAGGVAGRLFVRDDAVSV